MELSLKNQHIKSTDFLRLDYILYNKTRKKEGTIGGNEHLVT